MKYLWMIPLVTSAFAFDAEVQTQKELELLKKDPNVYYHLPPSKAKPTDTITPYVYKKIQFRDQYFPLPLGLSSQPNSNDQVRDLVWDPSRLETNYHDINRRGLYRSQSKVDPWSGHYYPVYRGVIAQRYSDKNFNESSTTWFRSYRYVAQHPAAEVYNTRDVEKINALSPAEKYDLVMGTDFAMTKKMWSLGKMFFERDGKVETWMGICHGWGPASMSINRPLKAITIPSAKHGIPITFYPADIKGLAAALYAYSRVNVNFIGARCDEPAPEQDENGRPTGDDCRDTNPASFHLALVNQIGITGRPVIMDTHYDFEVWNAPITGYRYLYFNPITKDVPRYMKDAVVDIRHYRRRDPHARHRSDRAKYVVGVSATIDYATETWATAKETDSPADDNHNRVVYLYDLELDENFNIIGGEWLKRQHPDFLWVPKPNNDVVTEGDLRLLDVPMWNMAEKVTAPFSKEAKIVAEKHGAPLALVLHRMIEMSRE